MDYAVERPLDSPAATGRLGGEIALMLRPGDFVGLTGPIGAGKTTLVRAVIEALAGETVEVPSPTFTLVQSYPDLRVPAAHFDLFRVEAVAEIGELGIEDERRSAAVLVEWADRMADGLPADRLDIALAEAGEEARMATLTGHGEWVGRLERASDLARFIDTAGCKGARRTWLKGDASARAYERLVRDRRTAVVMNAPGGADGPPVRDGKPYSRIAHLAEDVRAYIAIDGYLRGLGLSAPEILEADISRGFLLIEDLGDALYGSLAASDADLHEPYEAAIAALAILHAEPPPRHLETMGAPHTVPDYDLDAVLIEAELLVDWFWPATRGAPCPEAAREEYRTIWRELFAGLGGPEVLALRDFHSPNLLWLPARAGAGRAGIIDFQDALIGHPAYDVVSLAQDARVDLPEGFEEWLVGRYIACRPERVRPLGAAEFRMACAVLGAQRAAKIAGIFTRLARRDGKDGYLPHIPRVVRHLSANLRHPRLSRLEGWFSVHLDLEPATLEVAGSA